MISCRFVPGERNGDSQNNNYKTEVNIDSLEISNINLDDIKKDMLKYKIDDK